MRGGGDCCLRAWPRGPLSTRLSFPRREKQAGSPRLRSAGGRRREAGAASGSSPGASAIWVRRQGRGAGPRHPRAPGLQPPPVLSRPVLPGAPVSGSRHREARAPTPGAYPSREGTTGRAGPYYPGTRLEEAAALPAAALLPGRSPAPADPAGLARYCPGRARIPAGRAGCVTPGRPPERAPRLCTCRSLAPTWLSLGAPRTKYLDSLPILY